MSVATIERAGPAAVTAGFLNTDSEPARRAGRHGDPQRRIAHRRQCGDHRQPLCPRSARHGRLRHASARVHGLPSSHPRYCWYPAARPESQGSRSVGNDLRLEHELALLDVAAGLNFLREQGFRRIVLLGNSGGASLYAFYVQQSSLDGSRRLARTPGGRPVDLANLAMPQVDGFVFAGAAPRPRHVVDGEGMDPLGDGRARSIVCRSSARCSRSEERICRAFPPHQHIQRNFCSAIARPNAGAWPGSLAACRSPKS